MANTYKDIVITPYRGDANNNPVIRLSSGDATTNSDMNVRFYSTSNGTLSFEGASGQAFSVTNDLTGVIYSVNDISGIPSIEVDANGKINMAHFGGKVGIGNTAPGSKLVVQDTLTVNNSSVFEINPTWNGSGNTFTGMKVNVTDSNSAASSLIADFQVGGVSKIFIKKTGDINLHGGLQLGLDIYAPRYISITNNSGFFALGTFDTILSRKAAANFRLGDFDAASPVAQTLSVQSVVAGTANTAGANLTIQGSQSTGTAAGGSLIFQVAPAGAAANGTVQNTLATALTIDSTKNSTFAGIVITQQVMHSSSSPTGWYLFGSGIYGYIGGGQAFQLFSGSFNIDGGGTYQINNDTKLTRDAANTFAQRNGTANQTSRIYGTYTDGSNSERLSLSANSSGHYIIGEEGGTGSARSLYLGSNNATAVTIDTASRVGIGTTSPAAQFHLASTSANSYSTQLLQITSNTGARISTIKGDGRFYVGSDNGYNVVFSVDNKGEKKDSSYTMLVKDTYNLLMSSTSFVSDSPDFSFGANNFGGLLEFISPAGNGMIRNNRANTTIGQGSQAGSPDKTLRVWTTVANNATSLRVRESDWQGTQESFGVYANNDTTPRLVVANGNVGIGTSTPSEKLTVQGNVSIGSAGSDSYKLVFTNSTGSDSIRIRTVGSSTGWVLTSNGTDAIYFNNGSLQLPTIQAGTSVISQLFTNDGTGGRAFTANSSSLSGMLLRANNTSWYLDNRGSGSNNVFGLSNGGALALTVQQTGEVGIGITAPTAKLTVASGTSATTQHNYGTYTDSSNYERLAIIANSTAAYIQTEQAGTGTARPLYLGANGSVALTLGTNGNIIANNTLFVPNGISTTSSTVNVYTLPASSSIQSGASFYSTGTSASTLYLRPSSLAYNDLYGLYLVASASGASIYPGVYQPLTLNSGSQSGQPLSLQTYGGSTVTGGNLGIANTAPGSKFVVQDTVTVGSKSTVEINPTWNAGSNTVTALKMNVTDTASGSGSLLMDLQVGGASKFTLRKDGVINASGSITAEGISATSSGVSVLQISPTATYGFHMARDYSVTWGNNATLNGSLDLSLTRKGPANLRLGPADASAPVAQTLSVQGVVAGTSNTAGANLTIQGSQSTGTGVGGPIIFQVSPAGTAANGTVQNTLTNALTLSGDGTTYTFGPSSFGNFNITRTNNGYNTSATITLDAGGNINFGATLGGGNDACSARSNDTYSGFRVWNTGAFSFSPNSTVASAPDLILTRKAAATLRLGASDAASPIAQTLSVQGVVAGTANTAGANLTIQGSQSTGNAAGGPIIFQVAPAGTGAANTTQNALVTALTIAPNSSIYVANTVNDRIGDVRKLPTNAQTASYILTANDSGKMINITTGGITVPNTIFAGGDSITIYNNSSASQNITTAGGVTMYLVGTSLTGTRTLGQRGLATVVCVSANNFIATGGGLT